MDTSGIVVGPIRELVVRGVIVEGELEAANVEDGVDEGDGCSAVDVIGRVGINGAVDVEPGSSGDDVGGAADGSDGLDSETTVVDSVDALHALAIATQDDALQT